MKRHALFVVSVLAFAGVVLVAWWAWARYGVILLARDLNTSLNPKATEGINLAALGQTGDLFGGVNALFAALAFVGVGVAAFFQRESFVLLKREHEKEQFEPLFFRLLELTLDLRPKKLDINGRSAALSEVVGFHVNEIGNALRRSGSPNDKLGVITGHYDTFYEEYEQVLGPWFRALYHTFKLIDRSNLPEDEKIEYANIARAALGRAELQLLAVNCMTNRGAEFRALINRYGLLKHMPKANVERILLSDDLGVYQPTSYMSAAERAIWWADRKKQRA